MCSSQLLLYLTPWTNELSEWLKYVAVFPVWKGLVPGSWRSSSSSSTWQQGFSGVWVARRIWGQDYAADSTSSSARRDLWQILYSAVILLCVMVALGNIREKWSASSQGWEREREGGWGWFSPRIWFNPLPCESDSGEGAASCYSLSVHLPPSTTPGYSCHRSVVYPLPYLFFSPLPSTPWFLLRLLYNISFSQPQENADKKLYSP